MKVVKRDKLSVIKYKSYGDVTNSIEYIVNNIVIILYGDRRYLDLLW